MEWSTPVPPRPRSSSHGEGAPIEDPWIPILLTLAAIAYRGFARPAAGAAVLREAMNELLNFLPPVRGEWDLVWGPAGFRTGLHPFDDAAIYVARRRRPPSPLVIAVRGTNPISLFDWIFGDFIVTRQVPWVYGRGADADGAKISFSTALGLSIAQHLRWDPDSASPAPRPRRAIRPAAGARGAAAVLLPPLTRVARESLNGLRRQLIQNIRAASAITTSLSHESFVTWVETIRRRHASDEAARGLKAYDRSLRHLAGTRIDPLQLILSGTAIQQSFEQGVTLQRFLTELVAQADGPLDVYVTGHSKGGAICTALATWLADTQGRVQVAPEDQWDPQRKATLHAYAFASPTPGNRGFARHVDAVLGMRCHRIANRLDIVPHVFAAEDIASIVSLYEAPAVELNALAKLTARLGSSVEHLDYRHAGSQSLVLPGRRLLRKRLVAQVVHQHVDGYFEQMNLEGQMDRSTFFAPF